MFSLKEYLLGVSFVLLLASVIWGKEDVTLDFKPYNSSVVDVTCRYFGHQSGIEFRIYKEGMLCIRYDPAMKSITQDCPFKWRETSDPNELSFMVDLDGSCEENVNIDCVILNFEPPHKAHIQKSLLLAAQSDPPVISVNNDQPVAAGFKPVEITCTVANICYKAELKLDITVDVPKQQIKLTHIKHGNRFNTSSMWIAIFNYTGHYTIACKKTRKDDKYSLSVNLTVEEAQPEETERSDIYLMAYGLWKLTLLITRVIFMSSIFLVVCGGIGMFQFSERDNKFKLPEMPATPSATINKILKQWYKKMNDNAIKCGAALYIWLFIFMATEANKNSNNDLRRVSRTRWMAICVFTSLIMIIMILVIYILLKILEFLISIILISLAPILSFLISEGAIAFALCAVFFGIFWAVNF